MDRNGEKRKDPYVFVTFSNRGHGKRIFEGHIRPALDDQKIRYFTPDTTDAGARLDTTETKRIREASVIIADISDESSWVLYELGVARGASVPIIAICSKDSTVPSILSHVMVLQYDESSRFSMEGFKSRLLDAVKTYGTTPPRIRNKEWSVEDAEAALSEANRLARAQNLNEADDLLQEVLGSSVVETDKQIRADALHQIGLIEQARGEHNRAIAYLQEELEILEYLDNPEQELSALANLGNVLRDTGEIRKAESFYRKALELSQRLEDLQSRGIILANLSSLTIRQGRFDEAEALLHEAVKIFEETGDSGLRARTFAQLANVYESRGDFDHAERIFRQSIQYFEEVGDRSSVSSIQNNLASIMIEGQQYEEAEMLLASSIAIKEELGDLRGLAFSKQNLANIFSRTGRISESVQIMHEVISTYERIGDKFGLFNSLLFISNLFESQKRPDLSKDTLRQALQIARDLGIHDLHKLEQRVEASD